MDIYSFNPRPHMKGDPILLTTAVFSAGFNPRPHMKGDVNPVRGNYAVSGFNPRPHMKGDFDWSHKRHITTVSIHALT